MVAFSTPGVVIGLFRDVEQIPVVVDKWVPFGKVVMDPKWIMEVRCTLNN